jgi:hypothetical protein
VHLRSSLKDLAARGVFERSRPSKTHERARR